MREEKKETRERASTSSSSSHKGGSVLIDKNYEPLEVAIRAYESRLAALVDLPEKLKQYPNAREEKVRLVVDRQRIKDTQTMLEGPWPILPKGPVKLKPSLETILEVSSQAENAKSESKEAIEHSMCVSQEEIPLEEIPEADENLASAFGERLERRLMRIEVDEFLLHSHL